MRISISNPLIRDAIFLAYKGKCFFTGRPVTRENMVIDHLIPASKGGEDSLNNYVLTFGDLNIGKGNKIDEERIDRMKSVVEQVYAPRARKIIEQFRKIRSSKNIRKPTGLISIQRKDLFWVNDKELEILSESSSVTVENSNELLSDVNKFVEMARAEGCDYCIDVWLTSEYEKQIKSLWYQVGGKCFRLVRKTRLYDNTSLDKWAYVYFTKEFLQFLEWREKENTELEEIWNLEDEIEHSEALNNFCGKYPPPTKIREDIVN